MKLTKSLLRKLIKEEFEKNTPLLSALKKITLRTHHLKGALRSLEQIKKNPKKVEFFNNHGIDILKYHALQVKDLETLDKIKKDMRAEMDKLKAGTGDRGKLKELGELYRSRRAKKFRRIRKMLEYAREE